ncbi:Gp58 [Corynebacterium striatum]|nr:Gp58 [Corynebacterium striatum]
MPKKFRKKPVVVEAVQWTRNDAPRKLIDFTNGLVQIDDVEEVFKVYDRLHDEWIPFYWDDWIIKGVQGEFYPCKPEIFEATYEPENPNGTSVPGEWEYAVQYLTPDGWKYSRPSWENRWQDSEAVQEVRALRDHPGEETRLVRRLVSQPEVME